MAKGEKTIGNKLHLKAQFIYPMVFYVLALCYSSAGNSTVSVQDWFW